MMFEPHAMHPDPLTDHELAALPPDAQALASQLAADGAAWRAALPTTSALNARILTLARTDAESRDRSEETLVLDGQPPLPPSVPPSRHGRASVRGLSRLGRVAGIAAMAAVVILFAGVYALRAPGTRPGHRAGEPTATPAVTRDLAWQDQSQLGPAALGGAPNRTPVIAPSDPRVVYESFALLDASGRVIQGGWRRTDDAGATWHTLLLPYPAETYSLVVSPRDAHMIILKQSLPYSQPCPAIFSPPPGSQGWCQPQYRSTDGGMTWAPLVTPDYHIPGQYYMGLTHGRDGLSPAVLYAQGARLYSAVSCASSQYGPNGDDGSCLRIVASDDDGATWRIIDDALHAQGRAVWHYAVAPSGTTLFAITGQGVDSSESLSLWRSDDAGATWRRVSAAPSYASALTAVASADQGQPLLYLDAPQIIGYAPKGKTGRGNPVFSYLADDLKVSADGGHTWQSAPTLGASTLLLSPLGILADGSIVVGFVRDSGNPMRFAGPLTLYAWRLGDPGWRQLAPPLEIGMFIALVISHDAGHEALWIATSKNMPVPWQTPNATGSFETYDQYLVWRFQLS